MSGNGPPISGPPATLNPRPKAVAFRRTRAVAMPRRATIRECRRSAFPGACSRVARIFVRRITAGATARLRATRSRKIPPPVMSDFVASRECRFEETSHEQIACACRYHPGFIDGGHHPRCRRRTTGFCARAPGLMERHGVKKPDHGFCRVNRDRRRRKLCRTRRPHCRFRQ